MKDRRRGRSGAAIPAVRAITLCAVVALALTIPGVAGSDHGAAPSGATSHPALGLGEDLEYLSGSSLTARLDRYVEVGVKVARFQLLWAAVQAGGPASYHWQPVDAVVDGLVTRGIRPLPVIDSTPAWARSAACQSDETCAPAAARQYGAFAAAAAARYAPRGVHSWEIWNEPNNPIFWKPAPDPSAYATALQAAYAAIHRVDADATVISGGLAPTDTSSGWIAPLEFLAAIYAHGAHGSLDAVGWHPYDYPAVVGHHWDQMSVTEPSARSLMVANGDGDKRIWATEFGAPTCTGDPSCISESQQAQMITDAYALWRSYPWAGPLVVFSYQDRGTDENDREDFFGLVRADGTAKPALAALTALARAP